MLNTDGSFMSFQKPDTPIPTKALYCSPHQSRAAGRLKSGKTASPGQTGPTKVEPSALCTKMSFFMPSS